MQAFEYYTPTEIIFGKQTEKNVAKEIRKFGGNRVFIVYGGQSAVKSGLIKQITDLLYQEGFPYETLSGVKPNPHLSLVREGIRKAKDWKADFFLAVGGGSVIDTVKAIAHGVANPDIDVWDFYLGKQIIEKSMPIGVVLTIPAAGSEMSDSSVITDETKAQKKGVNTNFNRPKFAVLNPELTYTLPKEQITYGIADILMHTLERYFNHAALNDMTDRIAEELMKNVIKHGKTAIKNPQDYDAMSEIMWCGSLSHNGLTGLGADKDFATHKLGHEISGKFDVPHGASLTALWGFWASYVYMEKAERFALYAKQVWGIEKDTAQQSAVAGIEATVQFFRDIEAPTNFSELGIGIQEISVLEEMADRATNYGEITLGAFRKLDRADATAVYKSANH